MDIRIPKQFKIFGQTYKIKLDKKLTAKDDHIGQTQSRFNLIIIQPNCEGVPRKQSQIEQVYLHEVVHVVFGQLSEYALRDNEALVDRVASAFHQILTTSKY